MPWIKKVRHPHTCRPPETTGKAVGSIWQCRKCRIKWVLMGWDYMGDPVYEEYVGE